MLQLSSIYAFRFLPSDNRRFPLQVVTALLHLNCDCTLKRVKTAERVTRHARWSDLRWPLENTLLSLSTSDWSGDL